MKNYACGGIWFLKNDLDIYQSITFTFRFIYFKIPIFLDELPWPLSLTWLWSLTSPSISVKSLTCIILKLWPRIKLQTDKETKAI